ncbi:MAG: cellulose binding domain-containing protein, partial [Eubacterium sp.]|nr:cellulose binding domain-containing protein [Eubacterium sp.]
KNVGWNFEIAPSQSVTYGYTLSGNDLTLPDSFEIYSKRVDKTEGYDVQYNITKSWDVGVEGNIVITNTSSAPIEAWTLSFDSNFTIDNLWNGRVLENNGTSYTVAAEMWTNPVQPNNSMTIGFVGSKAADVEALLSNFRLTDVVIGEGMPIIPIDPPAEEIKITANAVYDEESGNISVLWTSDKQDGTFDILMSEDGENFVSVGTVEGVSEFVYTPENDFETLYFKVVQTVGEQAAESNVVAVAKSAEDIAISAEANYDKESGKITVSWTSSKENGTFEVFVSEDGENFTSVDIVEDVTEFVYSPNGEFEVLHFKVKQTIGELSAESNVVTVLEDEEDDYIDDVMSWDEMVDTDGDGLPDYIEYEYGTDINNTDTDGDGLPDGYEVLECGTNPALFDSDGNGISDADEDLDGDGLSNIEEYRLGTVPIVKDSDSDGLSDGEEVNIHNTDPLVYDNDSDGICDGDEIIKGLNPNNPATFGVPDSEYTFEQALNADNEVFNLINYDENPFELSLKLNAAGNAENSIVVSKSGYSIIMDNEAILGCVPEIYYNKNLKVDNIEISFDISQEYLIEPYSASDNELTGLHKYNIFTYNEDLNMLMPVATEYDEANSRIYTNVESIGTYFIVNMNTWISQLGIKSNSESALMSAYSLSENLDEESEYIDVAFLLYHNQAYSNVIKSELKKTVEQMYSNYDNIRVFFVVYSGSAYTCSLTGNKYAESVEEANNIINRIYYTPDINNLTMVNGFKGVNNLEWRENSQRHCFVIDVLVEPMCKYDMPAFTALAENNISTAICYGSANSNATIYKAMTPNTYANVVVIDRFLIPLIKFPEKDDTMFLSTNLLPVELNKEIKKNYVDAAADLYYNEDKRESYSDFSDTDNDGLYDFEEINFSTDLISFSDNDKVKLPTFAECLASTNNAKIMTAMDIYADKSFYEEAMDKNILLVNSDPTSEDGDEDGILDFDEVAIIKEELRNSTSSIGTFSATTIKDTDGDGIPDDVESAETVLDPNRIDTVVNLYAETIDKVVINNYIKNYDSSLNEIDYYKTGSIGSNTDKSWIEMLVTKNSKGEFTNNIIFHVNVKYSEYENNKLVSKPLTFEKVMKDKSGDTTVLKNKIEEMINTRWETSNVAGDYDFYKGMKIKTELKLHFDIQNKKYFTLEIHTNECGVSNVKEGKMATIYNSQCKVRPSVKATVTKKDHSGNTYTVNTYDGQELNSDTKATEVDNIIKIFHSDIKNGSGKTTKYWMESDGINFKKDSNGNKINNYNYCKYNDNQKTYDKMCGTLAHEFGHVLGLADNYADSNHNKKYHQTNNCKRLAADESNPDNATKNKYADMYKEFGTTDMLMHNNGYVSLNDIEMVIYAFKQGKWQYYTPYGCRKAGHDNISIAIRSRPLRYANNDESGSITHYSYP